MHCYTGWKNRSRQVIDLYVQQMTNSLKVLYNCSIAIWSVRGVVRV